MHQCAYLDVGKAEESLVRHTYDLGRLAQNTGRTPSTRREPEDWTGAKHQGMGRGTCMDTTMHASVIAALKQYKFI